MDKSDYRVSFPEIPGHTLKLRAYGVYKQDLSIDFHQTTRPYLVTRLLQNCTLTSSGSIPDASVFWNLTVGKRIQALFQLAMIGANSALTISITCAEKTCQRIMETEISQQEICALQHEADSIQSVSISIGDASVSLRIPKGLDQMKWLDMANNNTKTVKLNMIRDLLNPSDASATLKAKKINEKCFAALDKEMETADPLPSLSLSIQCPYCEHEDHYPIDLEEICLRILYQKQKALFRTIHCLAEHYHWSEDEILSIPHWRRLYYLDFLEKA